MHYLDDDMDELFQQAAEKYPLKTGAKDWDAVATLIAGTPVATTMPAATARKNTNTLLSILALVLFTAGLTAIILFHFSSKPAPGRLTIRGGINTTQDNAKHDLVKAPGSLSSFTGGTAAKTSNAYSSSPAILTGATRVNAQQRVQTEATISIMPPEKDCVQAALIATGSLGNALSKPENRPAEKKARGAYIGITAGLQVNQVSGQGFDKTGLSAGLLAGYRFGKKLSVETGFGFSTKYYYSQGSYFDMNKAGASMPANMTLLSMNGSLAVFEIPLKVKYDFAAGARSNWFISPGISSFLLTRESNDYLAMINGVKQNMKGDYRHKTGYFSAAAGFSIGYELRTGKKTTIRIEPYWQIPLKGIGIGSMQVMATGINIGVTNPFH